MPHVLCGVMQSFITRLFCLKKRCVSFFTSLLTSIGVTYSGPWVSNELTFFAISSLELGVETTLGQLCAWYGTLVLQCDLSYKPEGFQCVC